MIGRLMEMSKMDYIKVCIDIRNVEQDEIGGMIEPLVFTKEIKVEDMYKLFGDLCKRVADEK